MSYELIWNKLNDILSWLITTTVLAEVINHDAKTFDKFPIAVISIDDGDDVILDTVNNNSRYWFIIRVIDQNTDIWNMEDRMRNLVDKILSELRKKENMLLDWLVNKYDIKTKWGWQDIQFPTRVVEIMLNFYLLNQT